jgi:DNA-binding NtrC family response regulator
LGTHQSVDLNVRIICATNSDLHALAKEGKFRQDLLYRINTVEIVIPPLHERAEDILPLVNHYLRKFSVKYEKYDLVLSEDARIYLQQNHWPGNVRELQHAVELAVIMCDNKVLTRDDFGVAPGNANDFQFDHFNLEKLEAWAIRKAIAKHGGNITHAAEELGLSRGALYRRMEAYGI